MPAAELGDWWVKTVSSNKIKCVLSAFKDKEGMIDLLQKESDKGEEATKCDWAVDADRKEWTPNH